MPLVREDLGCLDELTLLEGTTAKEAASARVVELRGKGLTSVDPLASCARAGRHAGARRREEVDGTILLLL